MKEREIAFIAKSDIKHEGNLDYSKVKYVNNVTPVMLRCKKHDFKFEQIPATNLRGQTGCTSCIDDKIKARELVKTEKAKNTFLEKALAKHGDAFNFDNFVYIDSKTKGTITCNTCEQNYQSPPNNILKGQGCPTCATQTRSDTVTSKARNKFKDDANIVHDGKYCYDKFEYVDARTRSTITCPEHGDYEQKPTDHLSGRGCTPCSLKNKGGINQTTISRTLSVTPDAKKRLYYVEFTTIDGQKIYKVGLEYKKYHRWYNGSKTNYIFSVELPLQQAYDIEQHKVNNVCTNTKELSESFKGINNSTSLGGYTEISSTPIFTDEEIKYYLSLS